ncbi:MAG: Kelch repeat-containing protein [Flammeovirgaceae bacterium]
MIKFVNSLRMVIQMSLCLSALFLIGCSDDSDDDSVIGNYVKRSDFEGVARSGAVNFEINGKAYVGLGYDGDDYLSDFWEYDPDLNFWKRIANFPGVARTNGVAFAIGTKGYVGTGYDGSDELSDFWEYDPATDTWTQIADFGGTARYSAVAFGINNLGYVGTGYDGNFLKDFWQYDPATNEWAQIVSIPGSKREEAVAFVIDGKAYIGTGTNNGVFVMDFWEFDPNTGWTQKLDIDDDDDYEVDRSSGVAFTLNGFGYIGLGTNFNHLGNFWEYDPVNDIWTEKTDLTEEAAASRSDAVGFALGNRAYLTTGRNGTIRFDDMWEFVPNEDFNEDD